MENINNTEVKNIKNRAEQQTNRGSAAVQSTKIVKG